MTDPSDHEPEMRIDEWQEAPPPPDPDRSSSGMVISEFLPGLECRECGHVKPGAHCDWIEVCPKCGSGAWIRVSCRAVYAGGMSLLGIPPRMLGVLEVRRIWS